MQQNIEEKTGRDQVLIRLDTFIRLRWYAIIGQAGAVIAVAFGFKYPMPWAICLLLIVVSAGLNVMLTRIYKVSHRLPAQGAFNLLAFDILQLGLLLYLTGGLENPFTVLLLAPVVVSSTSLAQRHTVLLGALTVAVITFVSFFHLPLPWDPAQPLEIPRIYLAGVWVALVCTLGFTAIYAFRVAEETRKLADALTATELVLQREQHLSALDGLAAAAAHELGTPLATIALVSKEMVHAFKPETPLREDAELLRAQAERCREILQKLASLSSDEEPIIQQQPLTALLEEEVAPLRNFGADIIIHTQGDPATVPIVQRSPGAHYGIGNIIDNAVDFAENGVAIVVQWDDEFARIEISDDGPGFPQSIQDKLGEPFVSSRKTKTGTDQRGMGLGLFIAKTLLERSGAELIFQNRANGDLHHKGAYVRITWPRDQLNGTNIGVPA